MRSPAARYRVAKRALDVAVAAPVLVACSPLLGAVALAIRAQDGGKALYRGVRVGRDGKPFVMYKFRTMVPDADRVGGPSTASNDPRLTALAVPLRRWKLDELPQLVNVIKGDMSLVGPRPQVPEAVANYTDEERRLLSVLPGITDWASIRFRDEAAVLAQGPDPDTAYEELIRPEKSRLGLLYVDGACFRTDVSILWHTGRALLGRPWTAPALTQEAPPVGARR